LIHNGENGLIVDPRASAIADGVRTLMDNEELRTSFRNELKKDIYSSDEILRDYGKQIFA